MSPGKFLKKQLHSVAFSVTLPFLTFSEAYSCGWLAAKKAYPSEPDKWAEGGRRERDSRRHSLAHLSAGQ